MLPVNLTPPFGFALFYLKGVAPKFITTLNIWKGVVPFIALQLIGLGIVGFYPSLVNYLPARTYLTSHVAPPPMNPKLQYCLQDYKFDIYNNEEQRIKTAILSFQSLVPTDLPIDKLDIFEEHFENALGTFGLVKKLQKTEKEYNLFAEGYRDLHFSVRKKQKKIRKIDKKIEKLEANNLLGYIEGSDEKLKNELVIITAHYDHLGTDGTKIYNGADDDGSGTVAILEIAQAFAKAKADGKGARRSILIMPVTGEEKGLLGSQFYADVKPVFPLKNTVVNLNVDMVGRIDNDHKDGNYVYVIGADKLSSELHNINENMNKKYTKLDLNYKYNDDRDPNRFYYRSDHYNFAKNNVPVIFYFNGTHDDYHEPSDTVEKIDFAYQLPEEETNVGDTPYSDRGRQRNILGSLPTITGIFGLTIANQAILRLSRKSD